MRPSWPLRVTFQSGSLTTVRHRARYQSNGNFRSDRIVFARSSHPGREARKQPAMIAQQEQVLFLYTVRTYLLSKFFANFGLSQGEGGTLFKSTPTFTGAVSLVNAIAINPINHVALM